MTNEQIKEYIRKHKIFQYEVAEELNLSEPQFSKLFRREMDAHWKESIVQAVDKIYCRKHPDKIQKKKTAKKKTEPDVAENSNSLFHELFKGFRE